MAYPLSVTEHFILFILPTLNKSYTHVSPIQRDVSYVVSSVPHSFTVRLTNMCFNLHSILWRLHTPMLFYNEQVKQFDMLNIVKNIAQLQLQELLLKSILKFGNLKNDSPKFRFIFFIFLLFFIKLSLSIYNCLKASQSQNSAWCAVQLVCHFGGN